MGTSPPRPVGSTRPDPARTAWHAEAMTEPAGALEVALITVAPGAEEDFTAAFHGVRHVLASTPGCRSVRMTRGIESPSRFTLLVEWDSVEAHERNFRGSDRFEQWRAAIGPHFAEPPVVEHYRDV
jgi:heme-degrading monooxygenase HmoA